MSCKTAIKFTFIAVCAARRDGMRVIMKRFMLLLIIVLVVSGCAGRDNGGSRAVTISICYEDPFLEESVKLFNRLEPDTPVELNMFKPANDGDSLDKMYLNFVSTALMSGKADDIIVMSGLPYYKYYDMLTDFTPYIENATTLTADDIYPSLLGALRVDGKLFMLPVNYSIDILAFHDDYVEYFAAENGISFKTCNTVGRELLDKDSGLNKMSLYDQDGFQMFFWKLKNNYERVIDINKKEKNLNSDELLAMLEEYKDLEDKGYIPTAADFWAGNIPEKVLVKYDSISNLALILGYEEPFTGATAVTGDDGAVYFSSYLMLGINSASANKETAWRFIQFLLSEDRQNSPQLSDLPVNKTDFIKNARFRIEAAGQLRKEERKPFYGDIDAMTREYTEKVVKWTGQVRYYSYFEPIITDMIFSDGQRLFLENVPARDVAGSINNKVKLYLNE